MFLEILDITYPHYFSIGLTMPDMEAKHISFMLTTSGDGESWLLPAFSESELSVLCMLVSASHQAKER